MDLFYPELSVAVGPYTFSQGVSVMVFSDSDVPYDWATITFTPEFLDTVTLRKSDTGTVSMGYGGQLVPIFSGRVAEDFSTADSACQLLLRDCSELLQQTPINLVFTRATPQEIVAYCCQQAGITKLELSAEQYPQRSTVPMLRTNALAAIRSLGSLWGITVPSYFVGDTFVWGKPPQQQEQLLLEYGVNIIGLNRDGPLWALETVSLPFLRHGQTIQVKHPLVSGQQTIQRVVFRSNTKGFIRTFIYF